MEHTLSDRSGNNPELMSPDVTIMQEPLQYMRDVLKGWPAVSKIFLTPFAKENPTNFAIRRSKTTWIAYTEAVLRSVTGRIWRTSPMLTGNPKSQKLWQNIDKQGNHGEVFLRNVTRDGLESGQSFLYVAYPQVDEALGTVGDLEARDITSYWVHIKLDQVRNIAFDVIDGRTYLSLFAYKEWIELRDNFKVKPIEQWRVLRRTVSTDGVALITSELWRRNKNHKIVLMDGPFELKGLSTAEKPAEIPVVSMNFNPKSLFVSEPPFLNFAQQNVLDYFIKSLQLLNYGIIARPGIKARGVEALKVVTKDANGNEVTTYLPPDIVPGSVVMLSDDPNSMVEWMEADGKAVSVGSELLKDARSDMAILGMQFLEENKTAPETATSKGIDEKSVNDWIAQYTRTVEDAANMAWDFTARLDNYDAVPELKFDTAFKVDEVDVADAEDETTDDVQLPIAEATGSMEQ